MKKVIITTFVATDSLENAVRDAVENLTEPIPIGTIVDQQIRIEFEEDGVTKAVNVVGLSLVRK